MELKGIVTSARTKVSKAVDGVIRFAKLERVLIIVLISIPLLLILFDCGNIRASISHYYNMKRNQIFYFPLSVASMLFIVNGVVKERHYSNTCLGIMLAGAILFNRDDAPLAHYPFAIAFFGGNGVVIVFFSSIKERWFRWFFIGVIALSMLGYFVFHLFTLFWLEWISLAIIAIHYALESLEEEDRVTLVEWINQWLKKTPGVGNFLVSK